MPNEQVQQAAGQRQGRDNFETIGIASYQHLFSQNVVGDSRKPLSWKALIGVENGFDDSPSELSLTIPWINNRLNLIDFDGLFSGNSIAPPRSYSLRLTTNF